MLYEALAGDADVPAIGGCCKWTPAHRSMRWRGNGSIFRGLSCGLMSCRNYFASEALTAISVRQLIAGRFGLVLLAGTIRDEELEILRARPETR